MSVHEGHRERMRRQLKTSGMDSLSDVQVLEVALYYAIPRRDTNEIAHALLRRFGSLSGVLEAPRAELLMEQHRTAERHQQASGICQFGQHGQLPPPGRDIEQRTAFRLVLHRRPLFARQTARNL